MYRNNRTGYWILALFFAALRLCVKGFFFAVTGFDAKKQLSLLGGERRKNRMKKFEV
ncbi:MAG: hypothetical protein HND52_19865 [Ignavibacteriae bacterium]|nr:hypothetical protein [Ignavibacteriota bacterium]